MSLYANYIKEREGLSIIENDKGFVTYKISKPVIFIQDLYVAPEFRRTGAATEFGDAVVKIGKENQCSILRGDVCPTATGASEAMLFQLNYGMKISNSNQDIISLWKEI